MNIEIVLFLIVLAGLVVIAVRQNKKAGRHPLSSADDRIVSSAIEDVGDAYKKGNYFRIFLWVVGLLALAGVWFFFKYILPACC